jgi:UDP-N-acetylmuramoyl-L-alanyl-D-glutamate--2,6-diaminopimelate ligase
VELGELFRSANAKVPPGAVALDVSALAVDSRRVTPGALFAALPGVNADGSRFAAQAVARGAVAVLAGRDLDAGAPVVVADDPRRAFSLAAAHFHGEPPRAGSAPD